MSAATPTLTGCARAETTTKSSVEANDDATAGVEGLRRRSASSPLEQALSTTSVDPDAISGDDERLDGAQGGAPPQRAFLSALEGEKGAPSRGDRDDAGMTDCNICFEVACDPVVTQCGHLYCWSCIYKCVRTFFPRIRRPPAEDTPAAACHIFLLDADESFCRSSNAASLAPFAGGCKFSTRRSCARCARRGCARSWCVSPRRANPLPTDALLRRRTLPRAPGESFGFSPTSHFIFLSPAPPHAGYPAVRKRDVRGGP